MTREPFGLAVTRHALERLMDRSGFAVDAVAALCEAHDALLRVDSDTGSRLFDIDRLTLPAGSGGFLCTTRRFGPDNAPLAIARTWIDEDQAKPRQANDLSIWSRFLSNSK
jgi:hypothetical protein